LKQSKEVVEENMKVPETMMGEIKNWLELMSMSNDQGIKSNYRM